MKIVRFEFQGQKNFGVLEGPSIKILEGDPFADLKTQGSVPFNQVRLLAPSLPTKIIAVGLNYREHIEEMGMKVPSEPLIFLKALSALNGPEAPIHYPTMSQHVEFEGELAVVMKRRAKHIAPEKAADHILGYSCFNDVTARDLQKKDIQFARAKSFDTFACLGPWVETDLDVGDLKIETRLNGVTMQSSRTSKMLFSIPQLVSAVSQVMTLEPGDVITTGTPCGVGPMHPGDRVEVEIQGIGILANPVTKG